MQALWLILQAGGFAAGQELFTMPKPTNRPAQVTLTTDKGTQFTSTRFLATLRRLGSTRGEQRNITRKATATSNGSIAG